MFRRLLAGIIVSAALAVAGIAPACRAQPSVINVDDYATIDDAFQAAANLQRAVTVYFASHSYTFTQSETVPAYVTVKCSGETNTYLNAGSANVTLFTLSSNGGSVEDCNLLPSPGVTMSAPFIMITAPYTAVRNVYMNSPYIGIELKSSPAVIENVEMAGVQQTNGIGIQVEYSSGSDAWIDGVTISAAACCMKYDVEVVQAAALHINRSDFINGTVALMIDPVSSTAVTSTLVTDTYLDSSSQTGLSLNPSGTGEIEWFKMIGGQISVQSGADGADIFGVGTTTNISDVQFTSVLSRSLGKSLNRGDGYLISGSGTSGVRIIGGSIVGYGTGVSVGAGVSHVSITDANLGLTDHPPYGTILYQYLGTGVSLTGAADYYNIRGVDFTGSSTAISNSATGAHGRIEGNPGYDPVGSTTPTVSGPPWIFTNGPTPATLYLIGGTTVSATVGGKTVCPGSPCTIGLGSNEVTTVTWSGTAPTATLDTH